MTAATRAAPNLQGASGRAFISDSNSLRSPSLALVSDDPIEEFLDFYPPPIVRQTHRLRALVTRAVPEAVERVRPGWRLIGYDLPITRHGTYFAWVWPETEHVHVGWQVGTLMDDPKRLLRGAHVKLKKVRYLTFGPAERIPAKVVVDFTREAARVAALPRGERQLLSILRIATEDAKV